MMKPLTRANRTAKLSIIILSLAALVFLLSRYWVFRQEIRAANEVERAGQFNRAAEHLAAAARLFPGQGSLWERAGKLALKDQAFDGAIQYFYQAETHGGLDDSGWISLGDAYAAAGDPVKAEEMWKKPAPSPQLYQRLGQSHLSAGDVAGALEDWKAWLALDPNNADANLQVGMLQAALDPEAALVYLDRAAQIGQTNLSERQIAVQAQNLSLAITATRLQEEPAYSFLSTGRSLASIGAWSAAYVAFEHAVQARPDYAEAWAYFGEAHQHLPEAQLSDGRTELEKAFQLAPDSIAANSFLALYWERKDRFDVALGYLQTARQKDPQNYSFAIEEGNIYAGLSDLVTAQAAYQEAARLAPDQAEAWKALARFSTGKQVQVRELGLPAARQAVILAPDDPEGLDLLGQALFLLADYTSAERFFTRALENNSSYAPAHLHLGMVYYMKEEREQARSQIFLAQTLAPGSSASRQAERLLEQYFP